MTLISLSTSLKLVSIESLMPSNHLIVCRPLLLLTSIFPSIRVLSNEYFFFALMYDISYCHGAQKSKLELGIL